LQSLSSVWYLLHPQCCHETVLAACPWQGYRYVSHLIVRNLVSI